MLDLSYTKGVFCSLVFDPNKRKCVERYVNSWIRHIVGIFWLLSLCLPAAVSANSDVYHNSRMVQVVPTRFLSIPLADNQLNILRRLDPVCAAQLVGDAVNESFISAINLESEKKCDLRSNGREVLHEPDRGVSFSDASKNYSAKVTVIALPPRGFNLIKVSQNFGGSQSIVRYAVVTVLHGKWKTATKKTTKAIGPYILVNSVLPASIVDDKVAIKAGKLLVRSRY